MVLNNLLNIIKDSTGIMPRPLTTSHLGTSIVYKFMSLLDDGVKKQDKFEVSIISMNLEEIESLDSVIRKAILKAGENKHSDYLKAEIIGGGLLQNEGNDFIEKLLIYNITTRSELSE